VIPTPPLRPRNRLAETVLAALHDSQARARLAALGEEEAARRWLGDEDAAWAPAVAARARAATDALAGQARLDHAGDLDQALAAAAVLFDGGLPFEVHEVLEPHWAAAQGRERDALQGLIQVAVGWQHLANGNRAGARALLAEGAARLHGARLRGRDLDALARAAAGAALEVDAGATPAPPPFPRV
jgi:hypothetical protein